MTSLPNILHANQATRCDFFEHLISNSEVKGSVLGRPSRASMDKLAMTKKKQQRFFGPFQSLSSQQKKKDRSLVAQKYAQFSLREVINKERGPLMKKYPFSLAEMGVIIQIFWKVSDKKMFLTSDQFKTFMSSTFNYSIISKCQFRGYERFQSEQVMKLAEFVRFLWTLFRGSLEEKALLTFEIYDKDGFGVISFKTMMDILLPTVIEGYKNELLSDEGEYLHYLNFFQSKVMNNSNGISKESYLKFVKKNKDLMECFYPVWPRQDYIETMKKMILR